MCSNIYTSLLDSYIQFLINPIQQTKLGIGWDDTTIDFQLLPFEKIKNYHLKCSIPYAKQTINFEMYFNPLYPELGPELVFDDAEFLQLDNINYFENKLPSLLKWNTDNSTSLLQVLQEILELYKQYQVNLFKMHTNKLSTQCIEFINKISLNNLEVIVVERCKQVEAKFFIKLDLKLPTILFKKSTKMAILLLISIMNSSRNCIIHEVYLPTHLEKLFDGSETLHIPPFLDYKNIDNYASQLINCITEKINTISENVQKRKNFITVLLVLLSSCVIEYDIIAYRKASLLFTYADFSFILNFSLPISFPKTQFSMKLQFVHYVSYEEQPNYIDIKDFPYNSEWEFEHMIIEAVRHVFDEEIPKLQNVI